MRILIIGAGSTGSHLAKLLSGKGHEVIIVDTNENKIENVQKEADVQAYKRDATDVSLYEELDLETIDVVVAVTDKDEVNLLVATLARESGVPKVIARVRSPQIAKLLRKMGIEDVFNPPTLIANLIYSTIEGKRRIATLLPAFLGDYELVSLVIKEGDSSVGKRLGEIEIPEQAKIIAIYDGEKIIEPIPQIEIKPGLHMIALVHKEAVDELLRNFR